MTDPQILAEATRRIREQFHPREILLFGSRARGESRADSDFDLLVVLPGPVDWRTAGQILFALRGLPAEFDILATTQADWDRCRTVPMAFEQIVDQQAVDLLHAA